MQLAALERTRVRGDLLVVGSRRLMYLALIFLPMVRLKPFHSLNYSDLLFAVAAGLLLLSRRPPKKAPPTPAWYFGAFVMILTGIIASTQAVSRGASLLVVGNAVFVFIVLQWLLRQHIDSPNRMRLAISAFLLGASISAFVAVLQTTLHILLPAGVVSTSVGGSTRAIGLANQPNIAAVTFALGVIFAMGLALEFGMRRHLYVAGFLGVLVAALLLSASVSGISATLVGATVLFLVRGVPWRKVLAIAVVVGLVYALIFVLFPSGHLNPLSRFHQATTASSGHDTLQIRLDTITKNWGGIETSPVIGHGLDQATIANYYYSPLRVFYPAHNIVVLFWFAGGIFFVAGAALMMGSSFNRLLAGRLKYPTRRGDPMRDVILAGCVTVLFYSLQGPELVDRWLWLPFILALCFRDQEPAALLT